MTIISSIILGVVEGITEFLPISSTAHLVLTADLLKLAQTEFVKSFEIIIQLGAILAVATLYWRKLLTNWAILKRLIIAFLPTAIIGLTAYKFIKNYLLGNNLVILITLFLGGLVLILFERWYQGKEGSFSDLEKISWPQALIIGLCQSVAIIPGVSRSAATIIGGLILGLKREAIVEFSFLLAVPTMLAAAGLDLIKSSASFTINESGLLLVGFFVSFLAALLAIKSFLNYIRRHNFMIFGYYRVIVATLFALFLFF